MTFLCRIGWHKSESDPDRGEWAVRCKRCGRKGSWSLMSERTTWEPKPSYLWGFLKWFWDPLKHPHPDPEIRAELEGALYGRLQEHKERARTHMVNATVHQAKMLAHNEYARARALAFRRKGLNVKVPPSLIGRIHEKDRDCPHEGVSGQGK